MLDLQSRPDLEHVSMTAVQDDCPLLGLPLELIHNIYSYLDRSTISTSHLACSRLGSIEAEHLFETLHLVYTRDRFAKLDATYNHPTIPRRVQALHYQADRLRRCERLAEYIIYREYVATR